MRATGTGKTAEEGLLRATVFVLSILVIGQVVFYPGIADWIGRYVLRNGGGPEYPVLAYQILYVAPVAVVFLVGSTFLILRRPERSTRSLTPLIVVIFGVDLGLLVLSVAIYYRLVRGSG